MIIFDLLPGNETARVLTKVITRQMAEELVRSGANLKSDTAVALTLLAARFRASVIYRLMDDARDLAGRILMGDDDEG